MSEASIRTQWKKGQSGNPKGRPKKPNWPEPLKDQGEMLTHLARTLLDQPCDIFGGDPVTRRTRFMFDVLERAELGEMSCVRLLFDLADRGDRRRLQALRAAGRARDAKDKELEYRLADMVAEMTPGLRPDQRHVILPARERRTAHLKPPKPTNGRKYPLSPWAERDPLAGIPKHRSEEPANAADIAAKAAPETGSKAGPETGVKTGLGTGVITGPITGLSGLLYPPQASDASRKSDLLGGACDFSNLGRGHVAHVNGTSLNAAAPPRSDDFSHGGPSR